MQNQKVLNHNLSQLASGASAGISQNYLLCEQWIKWGAALHMQTYPFSPPDNTGRTLYPKKRFCSPRWTVGSIMSTLKAKEVTTAETKGHKDSFSSCNSSTRTQNVEWVVHKVSISIPLYTDRVPTWSWSRHWTPSVVFGPAVWIYMCLYEQTGRCDAVSANKRDHISWQVELRAGLWARAAIYTNLENALRINSEIDR